MTTTERGVMVPLWAMKDCEGDPRDAMLWAQITWWFQPSQRDGSSRTTHLVERGGETWMHTTDAELAEQTGMSADQVYRARRALMKRGLVESRSSSVKGQKVTLIRPIAEPDREGDQTADSRDLAADTRNPEPAYPREPPITNRGGRPENPSPANAVEVQRAPDDPVKRRAREITMIAFERDAKPDIAVRGKGGAFPAVMGLFERLLRQGHPVNDLERVARMPATEITWTLAGLQTAINLSRRKTNAGHEGNVAEIQELMTRDRD